MRHFIDKYAVNEYGELFSFKSGKQKKLKPYKTKKGYVMYRVCVDGKVKHYSAHHLSYWVNVDRFDTSDGLQIDHIDGNVLNNYFTNLRRISDRDNMNNINTRGELSERSRSGYRIYNNELLPEKYNPTEQFKVTKQHKIGSCILCGSDCQGTLCIACYKQDKQSHIPSNETLEKELLTGKSITYLSSLHGISDNAYRKWLKKRELPYRLKDIKEMLSV